MTTVLYMHSMLPATAVLVENDHVANLISSTMHKAKSLGWPSVLYWIRNGTRQYRSRIPEDIADKFALGFCKESTHPHITFEYPDD